MKRNRKKVIAVDIHLERRKARQFVDRLEEKKGQHIFEYYEPYIYDEKSIALGPDLSLHKLVHKPKKIFPSF